MGDWKAIKKGKKTSAHPTSLADTPTKQPLSSSASFGLLAVDELKQKKQTSQVDQIPATAPPPGTARNPSPLPNSNTKTKIFPGSTKTILAEINGKESAQMKKSAPATKPTSNKSNGKPRKTKDRPRVPKKAGIIRLRTLLLALTAYAAYHWAYTCPSQGYPPRSSATNVCKALYHLEHGVWRPYGVPAVQYVSSTKRVREAQEHYDNVVRPYVDPLLLQTQQLHHKYGAPMLAQAKSVFVAYGEPVVAHTQTLYRQHVDPHVQKGYSAVKKEYDTYLGRHVDAAYATVDEFYKKHVAPHATPAAKAANGVFQDYLVPAYKRTVPMVHQAGAAAVTVYNEMIDPLARKSFAFAKGSYEKHIVPTVTKLWDEHGKPHYEAALSKLGFRVEPALKRSATTKATEGAKAMFEDVVEGIKVRATEAAQAVKDKGSKASEASERAAQAAKAKAAAAKKKADELADQEAAKAKAKANTAQEAAKVKAKEAQEAAKAKANAAQEAAKAKAKEAQEAAKAKAQKAGEAVKAKAKEAQEATKAKAKSTGDTAKVKASQAQDAVKAKSAQGAKAASDTVQKVSDSVQNSLGEQAQHVMQMADDAEEADHEKVKEVKTAAIPKAEEKVSKVKEKVVSEVKTAAKEAKKKTNDAAESVKVGAEKVKGSVAGKVDAVKKVAGDAQRDAKAKITTGNEAQIWHLEL